MSKERRIALSDVGVNGMRLACVLHPFGTVSGSGSLTSNQGPMLHYRSLCAGYWIWPAAGRIARYVHTSVRVAEKEISLPVVKTRYSQRAVFGLSVWKTRQIARILFQTARAVDEGFPCQRTVFALTRATAERITATWRDRFLTKKSRSACDTQSSAGRHSAGSSKTIERFGVA